MSTSEVKQVLALIRSRSSSEQLAFVESLIVTLAQQVETAQSALSEANERASILQTALHERTAERDAARKALAASEARRGELEGEVRKHSLAIYAVTVQLNNFRIPMKSRVLNALEAIAALNPQQEGSRDHG